jgi:hypothetical protein
VTSDSQPAATPAPGYGDYPAVAGNGHGLGSANGHGLASGNGQGPASGNGHAPYPPSSQPVDPGPASEDYWQNPAPAHALPTHTQPTQADPGYQGAADYGNGHGYQGQHGQADYLPSGYPAGPQQDSGGYAPEDPYGNDESPGGYGGYPGYGAAER